MFSLVSLAGGLAGDPVLLVASRIAPQGLAGFSMGIFGPKIAGRIGVRRMLIVAGAVTFVGFIALTRLPSAGYSPLLTA